MAKFVSSAGGIIVMNNNNIIGVMKKFRNVSANTPRRAGNEYDFFSAVINVDDLSHIFCFKCG